MDSYEGAASIEWWANRSTCLGSFGVHVSIHVTGSGWTCNAILLPRLSEEEQEGFDFLMELDPLFTLRLDEENTILVNVVAAEADGQLTLTAYQAEGEERGTRIPG